MLNVDISLSKKDSATNESRRDFFKLLGKSAAAISGINFLPTAAYAESFINSANSDLKIFNEQHVRILRNIYDYFSPADFSLEQLIQENDPNYDHIPVLDAYFYASGEAASADILSFLSLLKKAPLVGGFSLKGFHNLSQRQLKDFFPFLQYNEENALQLAFKAAKSLALLSIYSHESVAWKEIQYTGTAVPRNKDGVIETPRPKAYSPFDKEMQDNLDVLEKNVLTLETIENLKPTAGTLVKNSDKEIVIETDVLVVGTGAGASVTALNFSEQTDLRVLSLEKGELILPHEFDQREMSSRSRFLDFEISKNGLTTNGNVAVRGRLVGGSATINQALCALTPNKILQDWKKDYGINFNNGEFQNSLEEIGTMLNISKEGFPDMGSGRVLSEGGKKLGYEVEESSRNTKNCISAGFCDLGCRNNRKLTPLNVILPRAARSGLQILSQCEVSKVIYKKDFSIQKGFVGHKKLGQAQGIKGFFLDKAKKKIRKVKILAKKVILGAGSFGSTRILLNSDIQHLRKRHDKKTGVGSHFSNHATYSMAGVFDKPIFQNIGAPLTRTLKVYDDKNDKNNSHVSFALEASNRHPVNHSLLIPYESPEKHLEWMKQYNNTATFTVLIRDSAYGGRKSSKAKIGKESFKYSMQEKDFGTFLDALKLSAKIMFEHGAHSILLNHIEPVIIRKDDDLDKVFSTESLPLSSFDVGSAHLMGGCRMGNRPDLDVVDPKGESWDIKGLYVMDSAIFPTSLGVNPSYTIYAMADYLSKKLIQRIYA